MPKSTAIAYAEAASAFAEHLKSPNGIHIHYSLIIDSPLSSLFFPLSQPLPQYIHTHHTQTRPPAPTAPSLNPLPLPFPSFPSKLPYPHLPRRKHSSRHLLDSLMLIYLPSCLPLSLPICLPPSLFPSLPPNLPPYLPTSLPIYLPPSLPPTFLPSYLLTTLYLPLSLPPYLPTSLPPYLPTSLPTSLPTNLPTYIPIRSSPSPILSPPFTHTLEYIQSRNMATYERGLVMWREREGAEGRCGFGGFGEVVDWWKRGGGWGWESEMGL